MKLSFRQLYLAVALKGALLTSTFFEASAMNMDTMLMGQNLEDFLTGINASQQHKSAIPRMAAQNMANGNGGGNGKENYRDKGFATKKAKSELTAYLYESLVMAVCRRKQLNGLHPLPSNTGYKGELHVIFVH